MLMTYTAFSKHYTKKKKRNLCNNRLQKSLLMTHCANSFTDIDHPHSVYAHLGKTDIAVEAHISTK